MVVDWGASAHGVEIEAAWRADSTEAKLQASGCTSWLGRALARRWGRAALGEVVEFMVLASLVILRRARGSQLTTA
jgi:hypothetical protein